MSEQPEFRKNKKFTPEQKQEIIAYAAEHGVQAAKSKYGVWPENIRYWTNADLKKKAQESANARYKHKRENGIVTEREKQYEQHLKDSGVKAKRWKEWYNNLPPDQKAARIESIKQHRLEHIDEYKERMRITNKRHQPIIRERYRTDPLVRLRAGIRHHVSEALKYARIAKDHPSMSYLGCTVDEFKKYIESKFLENMTWLNHGRGPDCWHLDHIKPLAALQSMDEAALKEICHYTNYQPLWEKDNLAKNAVFEGKDMRILNKQAREANERSTNS